MVNKGVRGRKNKATKTEFHDSFNILPMPLSKLPKTFNLRNAKNEILEEKGIFPYMFNQPENYSIEYNELPTIDYYDVPNMKKSQYEHFRSW